MRLFSYGLSLALLSFCLLGLSGCGEDNASLVDQQASKTSGTKVELKTPQAQDQRQFGEQSKGGTANPPAGYPKKR
jgi:hypothetical protein